LIISGPGNKEKNGTARRLSLPHFGVDLSTPYREGRAVSQKLFGTDGVRGIANTEPITATAALRLAGAAARVLARDQSGSPPLVGRDKRGSGGMPEAANGAGPAFRGVC